MNKINQLFLLVLFGLIAGCKPTLTTHNTGQGTVSVQGVTAACKNELPNCYQTEKDVVLTLSAEPADGYVFAGWNGACKGTELCTVKMTDDHTAWAIFLSTSLAAAEFKPGTDRFFSAPWPNDALHRNSDGSLSVKHFPFPKNSRWESQITSLARKTQGFSLNGGSFFTFQTQDPGDIEFYEGKWSEGSSAYHPWILINVDQNSPNYASIVPSTMQMHTDPDDPNMIQVVITPALGHPLEPDTTYATVLMQNNYISWTQSALVRALDEDYHPGLHIDAALFNSLAAQKQAIAMALDQYGVTSKADINAFTYFTTQDPQHLNKAISNTLSRLSTQDVISSVKAINQLQSCMCNGPGCVEAFELVTEVPLFLKGSAPYLFTGGQIEVSDDKAVIQKYTTLHYLLKVPCETFPNGRFPLSVHAMSTLNYWTQYYYEDEDEQRRIMEIMLDAPESNARRLSSTASNLLSFLNTFNVKAGYLLDMLTDFNVLNLNAALGIHHQYAAELFYAELLGRNLPEILQVHLDLDSTTLEHYTPDPERFVLSGRSLGGIAAIHALSMDTWANMATIEKPPRPSYIHIETILQFMFEFSPSLAKHISSYSGISLDLRSPHAQPLAHLTQTVLEPIDTLNYVKGMNTENLFLVLSKIDDPVHGGESAFSLATALEQVSNIQAIFTGQGAYSGSQIYDYMQGEPLFNGFSGYNNSVGNQFISVEDDWLDPTEPTARLEMCFPYDTYAKPYYDSSINMVSYHTIDILCQ